MAARTKDMLEQRAAAANQPASRAEEQAIREVLERERGELGEIATTEELTEPDDATTLARFIGGLRRRREQAGLSLAGVADRSGIDKAALSRLENGWYPNPTVNTLARYARAIGSRLIVALEERP